MGTRSVVATRYPDGVKGRYIHWDGYPTHMAKALFQIVARDGLEGAAYTLMEAHYSWSSIDPGQQDGPLSAGMNDGRFVTVPGYGVAYTTEQGQSSPDEWHRPDERDTWCEYAYVIAPAGLMMCVIGRNEAWLVLGTIPWTASADEIMRLAEQADDTDEYHATVVPFTSELV